MTSAKKPTKPAKKTGRKKTTKPQSKPDSAAQSNDDPLNSRQFGTMTYAGDLQDLELLDALRDCVDTWMAFDEKLMSGPRVEAVRNLVECGLIEESRLIKYRLDGEPEPLLLAITRRGIPAPGLAEKRIVAEFPSQWRLSFFGGRALSQDELPPMRIRLTAAGLQQVADLSCETAEMTKAFQVFLDMVHNRGAFTSGAHRSLGSDVSATVTVSPPPPPADGPFGRDGFRFEGKPYHGLTNAVWTFLNVLWERPGWTADFRDFAKALNDEDDFYVDADTTVLGSLRRQANKFFEGHNLPLRASVSAGKRRQAFLVRTEDAK